MGSVSLRHLLISALLAVVATSSVGAATQRNEDYRRAKAAYERDDLVTALRFLRKAMADHPPAQALLAYILDKAEQNEEAMTLYKQAAASGNADAMYGLASMYASGEVGEHDFEQARRWFEAAVDSGHQHAAVVLAEAYLAGGLGLSVDRERAIELLRQSAANGYEPARERLSRLGAEG